jgi:hypothetical protein
MRWSVFIALSAFFLWTGLGAAQAQDLSVHSEDLWITQGADGGFHLYIRKKPDIRSVLLSESTRDPAMREHNYAYRAAEWNPVNGNELRMLNGVPIPPTDNIFSLIDSTPELVPDIGEVFHIYIPYMLYYGYADTRHGEVAVGDGTYFNIRSFYYPYADYAGAFADNPFVIEVTQRPLEGPPEYNYMTDTENAFREITGNGGGVLLKSRGAEDLVPLIAALVANEPSGLDLVVCLDTTDSMGDDLEAIKNGLLPALYAVASGALADSGNAPPRFRLGLLLFKDYYEDYLTQVVPLTADFNVIQRALNGVKARGGRDIPEAIYEALYDAATKMQWQAKNRLIILISDAPPHLRPRGKITQTLADQAVSERNIRVSAIILPQ